MQREKNEYLSRAKEKQGEFFAEFQAPSIKKRGHLFKQDATIRKKITLNLSYENLILFFIIVIMLLVVFFSLGVEKGKKITLQDNKIIIAKRVNMPIEKEKSLEEKKNEIIISKKNDQFETTEKNESVKTKVDAGPVKLYTIQVIAFKKEKDVKVKKEMEYLKNQGYDVFVIPSGEWVQICVGRYANREESKKALDILKKRYPTCYVRNIDR